MRYLVVLLLIGTAIAEEGVRPPAPPPEVLDKFERAEPKAVPVVHKVEAPTRSLKDGEILRSVLVSAGEKQRLDLIATIEQNMTTHSTNAQYIKNCKQTISDLKKRKNNYGTQLKLESGGLGSIIRGGTREPSPIKVIQIIDGNNMICRYDGESDDTTTFWIQKIGTGGAVDGERMTLNNTFRYAGTKQYKTALGSSKTVHLIEPVTVIED